MQENGSTYSADYVYDKNIFLIKWKILLRIYLHLFIRILLLIFYTYTGMSHTRTITRERIVDEEGGRR